ncbi:MAG: hypothetical protein JNK05_16580 [Myxococcales bacterium]|nr:hypothetical protein [Myxococcales bacterium]
MWSSASRRCRRCGARYERNELSCLRCPPPTNPNEIQLEVEQPQLLRAKIGSLQVLQGERPIGDGVLRRALDIETLEPATVWFCAVDRDQGSQWLSRIERVRHPFAFAPERTYTLSETRDWSQVAASIRGTPTAALDSRRGAMDAPRALSLALSLASAARAYVADEVDCARIELRRVLLDHPDASTARFLPGRAPAQRSRVASNFDEPAVHQMAPEAFGERGRESFDPCAQYAIGSVLFELLTARTPFEGEAMQVVVRKRREEAPDPRSIAPSIPEGLARVVSRLLARAPGDRYATIDEAIAALLREGRALVAEYETAPDPRPFEARLGAPDLRRFARVEHSTRASRRDDPAALWESLFARGLLPERWIDAPRRAFAHRRCPSCTDERASPDCPRCRATRWASIEASPRSVTDALMFASSVEQVEAAESLALEALRGFLPPAIGHAIDRIVWEPVEGPSPPPFVFALRETWGGQPYSEATDELTVPVYALLWWRRLAVAARRASDRSSKTDGVEPRYWRALHALLAQGFIVCGLAGPTLSLGFRPLARADIVDSR